MKCHFSLYIGKFVTNYDVLKKAFVDYQNRFEKPKPPKEPEEPFSVQAMIEKVWREDVNGIRTEGFWADPKDPGFDRLIQMIRETYK